MRGERVSDDEKGVLLSEFAAYELGFTDPSRWDELIGQRVVIRISVDEDFLAKQLQGMAVLGGGDVSIADVSELTQWLDQLPAALEESGMSAEQVQTLLTILGAAKGDSEASNSTEATDGETRPKQKPSHS